jgi:hypothetical protein
MKRFLVVLFIICLAFPVLAQEPAPDAGPAVEEVVPVEVVPAVELAPEVLEAAEPAVEEKPAVPVEEVYTPPPVEVSGEPKTVTDAVATGLGAVNSFKKGDWLLGVSAVLMLLIFFLRKFWKSMPKAWAPWVSVGVGAVGAMASAWSMGEPLLGGLLYGVSAGLGAIGVWEAGCKKVLKKATPAVPPAADA